MCRTLIAFIGTAMAVSIPQAGLAADLRAGATFVHAVPQGGPGMATLRHVTVGDE